MTKENENIEFEIEQAWKKLSDEKFNNKPLKKIEIMNAINLESKSEISNLKKGLIYKNRFAIAFGVLFAIMALFDTSESTHRLFYFILSVSYFIAALLMFRMYSKIDIQNDYSILELLKQNLKYVKSTLKIENIWGVLTFGFIGIYYTLYFANKSLTANPKTMMLVIAGFISFLIIAWFIAQKMNQSRFGKQIRKLEDNIVRLETIG